MSGWNFNLNNGLFDGVDLSGAINPSGVTNSFMPMNGLSDFTNVGSGNTGVKSVGGWNTFSNVLGGVSGLANAFTGFKQLGLAKDQFNWQKGAFNTNLVNQANLVNSQLEDRQRRRQMSDSNAIPVAEYMQRFGAASSVQEAQQRQQQNQNAWNNSQGMNKVSTGG